MVYLTKKISIFFFNNILFKIIFVIILMTFWEEIYEILKKVTHPDYENELGDKYFLRVWAKL